MGGASGPGFEGPVNYRPLRRDGLSIPALCHVSRFSIHEASGQGKGRRHCKKCNCLTVSPSYSPVPSFRATLVVSFERIGIPTWTCCVMDREPAARRKEPAYGNSHDQGTSRAFLAASSPIA
jgi:hypothetical protein